MEPLSVKKDFYPEFLKNKWWHTLGCAIFILILSLIPQENIPKPIFGWEDLIVHFIMYGALSYCLVGTFFKDIKSSRWVHIYFVFIFIGLFGLSVEILQKILPVNRFFSISDALCNLLGAAIFPLKSYFIKK